MITKVPLYKNKKFLVSLMGIFIIGLMILSSLNIFKTEDSSKQIKYKDRIFYSQGGQWITYINDKPIVFSYNPIEVENITIPNFNFFLPKVYISYDPSDLNNENFIINRLYSMFLYFNIRPVLSCYTEKDCPDIPIIDCSKDNSIYVKYSNDTKIYIEDKCLVLEGTIDSQIKYTDKIFYNMLNI